MSTPEAPGRVLTLVEARDAVWGAACAIERAAWPDINATVDRVHGCSVRDEQDVRTQAVVTRLDLDGADVRHRVWGDVRTPEHGSETSAAAQERRARAGVG